GWGVGVVGGGAEVRCRKEEVYEVGTSQQLPQRLVGWTVRDTKFQSILQKQKFGVMAGNLVGIGTHEPVQVVLEITRSRAVSVLGAARANAKRIAGGDRESKNESARAHHAAGTIQLIWSQRGLPGERGPGQF